MSDGREADEREGEPALAPMPGFDLNAPLYEEPDLDDEDEEILDAVWDRIGAEVDDEDDEDDDDGQDEGDE